MIPLHEIYLQIDYGSELVYFVMLSVVGFIFAVLYYEWWRHRMQPDIQKIVETARDATQRGSSNVPSAMQEAMEKLPSQFRLRTCPSCGMFLRPGARFCDNCGKAMEIRETKTCPKCGTAWSSSSKFCANCGQVL